MQWTLSHPGLISSALRKMQTHQDMLHDANPNEILHAATSGQLST